MKKKDVGLICASIILSFVFWKGKEVLIQTHFSSQIPTSTVSSQNKLQDVIISPSQTTTLKVVDRIPSSIAKPEWEEKFTAKLKKQGGDYIKDIDIKKIAVTTWKGDGPSISAESVIVTLTNKDGEESSFRALVEPKTGKVLASWDRSIFEPVRVWEKDDHKLKIHDHHHD